MIRLEAVNYTRYTGACHTMNTAPRIPVSAIVESVEPAWRGMVSQLFRPFDIAHWLALGFTAWLATLGEGGGGGGFRRHVHDPHSVMDRISAAWHEHPGLFLGIVAMAVVVTTALAILFVWLRSRGTFMFLDNLVHRRAAVVEPWQRWRDLAQSLFWWRLGFALVAIMAFALALVPVAVVIGMHVFAKGHGVLIRLGLAIPLVALFLLVVVYVSLFLNSFVVPIMYRHDERATAAWRRFGRLWSTSKGALLLYGLFLLVLSMAVGAVVAVACLLTCCCLFILMVIPYIGAVVLLPATVFYRLYSLEVLRSAGPEFDLFAAPPPDLPPPLQDQPAADVAI